MTTLLEAIEDIIDEEIETAKGRIRSRVREYLGAPVESDEPTHRLRYHEVDDLLLRIKELAASKNKPIFARDIMESLNISRNQATRLLKTLVNQGALVVQGEKSGTNYTVVSDYEEKKKRTRAEQA